MVTTLQEIESELGLDVTVRDVDSQPWGVWFCHTEAVVSTDTWRNKLKNLSLTLAHLGADCLVCL